MFDKTTLDTNSIPYTHYIDFVLICLGLEGA